jgi:outer membrane protein TolC
MGIKEAALAAGKRRMRPIFLTAAAASVGVIPMILSRSPLWGPLGTVICFGLLTSMVLTLFVLPVLYTIIFSEKKNRVVRKRHIPYLNGWKKGTPVVIVALLLAGGSHVTDMKAQNHVLSIDSCKSLAIKNNKKIKESKFEVEAALAVKKNAFTNYFPKVNGMAMGMRSANYLVDMNIPTMNLPVYDGNPASLATATQFTYVPETPIKAMKSMNMANIMVAQPIFSGGRIINGNRLAKISYEIYKQKRQLTTTEVLFKTEELYWNVIALKEKLNTLNKYEKLLNQLHEDVTAYVKAGLTQQSDLLKIQLKQNELKVNRLKLENGIMLSKMALCQHIGITYDNSLELDKTTEEANLPETYFADPKTAVYNREEYQMLAKAVKAEKLQKQIAIGENLPQIAIGAAGYSYEAMDKTTSNVIGFASVSIPISDWWGGSYKIKEAQLKVKQAENKLSETSELLVLQIQQAKNELNETYFQIGIAQSSIDQAKENMKVVEDNYKAGVSSMSDLLEAQAIYQDALNQYTDAVCNYKIKTANYLQKTGRFK